MKRLEKILYMGTPEMSAIVLESLILEGYNIVGVVAQCDKPVGRKKILEKVPTKVVAEKYNIPVFQPEKIRLDYEFVKDLNPDLILTLAYGQIVPQGLLDIPRLGCINLHGSLLPKYRGAAPMQYALIEGEKVTGMTLMQMIDKMDAGIMYAKEEVTISEDDTLTTLTSKMTNCAKDLILRTLPLYLDGKLNGEPQDESLVTFCPTIKKEQEHLDLNLDAKKVVNWIRALNDHPGAYLYLDNVKIKIWKARVINDKITKTLGEIISADKNGLIMQGKNGQISLLELQKEGKNKMDYRSFINGNQNLVGKILK
ncbi:MAG: methionyl-tRNA formyltransferase [Erysipelotrichales bacterium]|nr:methionyl-tRNA formyltransferase [Erysipelotrichales bacterium]